MKLVSLRGQGEGVAQRGQNEGGGKGAAHTTRPVLLIKDGRGPAGNYPLISNSPNTTQKEQSETERKPRMDVCMCVLSLGGM